MLQDLNGLMAQQQHQLETLLDKEQALIEQAVTEGRPMNETKMRLAMAAQERDVKQQPSARAQAMRDAQAIRDKAIDLLALQLEQAGGDVSSPDFLETLGGMLSAHNIVKVLGGARE